MQNGIIVISGNSDKHINGDCRINFRKLLFQQLMISKQMVRGKRRMRRTIFVVVQRHLVENMSQPELAGVVHRPAGVSRPTISH